MHTPGVYTILKWEIVHRTKQEERLKIRDRVIRKRRRSQKNNKISSSVVAERVEQKKKKTKY